MATVKVDWKPRMRTSFIEAMRHVHEQGGSSDNGFRSREWTEIKERFTEVTGLDYSKQQLQNQHAELKKKYAVFLHELIHSNKIMEHHRTIYKITLKRKTITRHNNEDRESLFHDTKNTLYNISQG